MEAKRFLFDPVKHQWILETELYLKNISIIQRIQTKTDIVKSTIRRGSCSQTNDEISFIKRRKTKKRSLRSFSNFFFITVY